MSFKIVYEVGVIVIVLKICILVNWKKGLFIKEDFVYKKEKDVYECFVGKDILFSFVLIDKGKLLCVYMLVMICKGCIMKLWCIILLVGRWIWRFDDEEYVECVV